MENKCAICGKQGDLFTLEYEEDGEQCARKVCGATGRVAVQHGRQYVGLELNPEYIKLAPDRMTVQVVMI